MKLIFWIGSSREIQKSKDPGNIKLLKHLKEAGVWEIVVDE